MSRTSREISFHLSDDGAPNTSNGLFYVRDDKGELAFKSLFAIDGGSGIATVVALASSFQARFPDVAAHLIDVTGQEGEPTLTSVEELCFTADASTTAIRVGTEQADI